MTWYKKVLRSEGADIKSFLTWFSIFLLITLLWGFFSGKSFEWQTISPIDEPSIFHRAFYSALVFVTLGAFLYWIKFYRLLYYISFKDWELFKALKGLVWGSLILLMYFWIVPKVVWVLNMTLSFFFNLYNLILYLFPPLGVSLIVFSIVLILIRKLKSKT